MSLNCVSPKNATDPVLTGSSSFDGRDRRQYTPIDKQENLFKKQGQVSNNNASQESTSTSPFHPMKLHPISPDASTTSSKTPMQKGSFKGASPKKSSSKRNSKDRYRFSPAEGMDYYQDESVATPLTGQSTPMGDDQLLRLSPVLSAGGASNTTSRSSHRAPTPTVNNTSATRGLSFATISPDGNDTTNQSSTLGNTMDQSSLMNTMNLISGSEDSSSDEEEPQSARRPSPRARPNQAQRRSSDAKLKQLPYEKADTIKGRADEETPHYYHPAYWNQRLARREVFSRRYRPNAQERDELQQVEDFLGIPEARKSRRTILVQQWRLLNPSTSQASDENIPMSIVLKRGPVSWGSHEECELILLTRGLVIARKVFQYIPRFQLGEVWTNVDRVIATGLTSFTIECKDKSLDFSCPTASEQQAWMAALRIVVLQAFTHQASLLDIDDEEAGSRFTPGWQYQVVQTPWFSEAVTGQVQLESGMLDQMDNATLNQLDSYNQSAPLHYAVRANNVDAIRFLLQAGADPNLEDGMGRTAVQYAEEDKLPNSSIELLQTYGGKSSIANTTCFQSTPKKTTFSRKCRLGTMAIIFLLLVATGVTVFVIWFLGKEDPNAANGISSQQDAVTQDDNDMEPSADVAESDSDSPPPFLVVGVNPIPATNLTTDSPYPSTLGGATLAPTSVPANEDSTNPTDGLIDAESDGIETVVDSLAELLLDQTNADLTGSAQPTLSPSFSPVEPTTTPSTVAPTAISPSTARPTYPTWEEGTDFLPLTTEPPTFLTMVAPTAMPTEKLFVPEFVPLDTNTPTFVVAIPATTEAPTVAAISTDTPTQSPTTLAPTEGPTRSPITFAPTYFPTGSPTTISPTYTPTSSPSAFVVGESAAYVLTTAPVPTNFPTIANIHGADLLPEDIMLFDFLVENSLDKGEALHNPKSPQYKAFRWLSGNVLLTSYSDERKIQRYVLATLYYSTGGESWSNNQYWLSDEDECTMWFSRISEVVSNAVCNSEGQMITLDLDYNNLRGRLPKQVGLLTKLRRMELYGGPQWFLTGTLPTEVALLGELESLSVRGNRLTGAIPSELGSCATLSNLNLSQNRLSGNIPTNLGALGRLQAIAMETNRLKGSVPSQLGRVSTLRSITLGTNSLTGSIFTEIGLLTGLRGFDLEMNQLSSTIPSEMGMLGNLTLFHMSSSGLYGTLPWEVGNMRSLESLQLRGNRLDDSIPFSIGQLTSLGALDLSFNHLSGSIPGELGQATLLRSLFLNANKLSGNIPADVASLSRLNTLRLEANDLTGAVPVDVCDVFFTTYPIFYADCFEVACPCCSYCCVDGEGCECVYAGTMDEFLC